MLWRSAVRLALLGAISLEQTFAALITITEYPSSCKAIYTSGSRSVTVLQSVTIPRSTVIVSPSPTPWTDSDANNGKPFVLEIQDSGEAGKRATAALGWVRPDGGTTTSVEDAAQYIIDEEGRLTSPDGAYVSTDASDTRFQPFALAPTLKAINTVFSVDQGALVWANPAFSDGISRFYRIGELGAPLGQRIIVRFGGSLDISWEPVILAARPVELQSQGPSGTSTPYPPSTAISKSIGDGQSSGSGYSYRTSSYIHSPTSSTNAYPSQSSSSPPATGNVSPNGLCGGDSGYTCIGSTFGDCCSRHGECGTDRRHCNNGCQPIYGICWSFSSSLARTSTGTLWTSIVLVSPSPVTPGSSSSSASIPLSTYTWAGGPIGPINPLSSDVSISTTSNTQTAYLGPSQITIISFSSFPASQPSATASSAPVVAPCPTSASSLCASPDNSATCSSPGGTAYNNSCGIQYEGTFIDTSNIVGLPPLQKRAVESSLADCQTLCDRYSYCIALNYAGTNCELLRAVTGKKYVSGAVGAVVPPQYVPAKINPASSVMAISATGNSNAGASSTIIIPSTSGLAAALPTSSSPQMIPSSNPQMVMSSSNLAAAASSSNPAGAMSSSSTSVMILTTISEILTSTTPSGMTAQSLSSELYPSSQALAASNPTLPTDEPPSEITPSTAVTSPGAVPASSILIGSGPMSPLTSPSISSSMSPISSAAAISSSQASSAAISSSPPVSSSAVITSASPPSSTAISSSTSASSSSTNTYYLILPSPTPCDFGNVQEDGTVLDEDDSYSEIQLPFQMQIYSQRSSKTFASVNGYISIQHGSSQYSNQPFPASNLPSNTVAPFFDDLYLAGNSTPQTGIFYQISNGAVTYEYYLNRGWNTGVVDTSETFHFTVHYDSAQPGVFTYTYYQTGGAADNGLYAAVGMQGIDSIGTEQGVTYSFQSARITPGLVVRCNTQIGTCVTVQR